MTNVVSSFDGHAQIHPDRVALWLPDQGEMTFAQLDQLARRAGAALLHAQVRPGDRILLFVDLSFDLYAWIIAAARLGVAILLVEPWMPLARIQRIVDRQQPRVFVATRLGRLWGLRIRAIRRIPHHIAAASIHALAPDGHGTERVAPSHPCIITFTSGSTGEPKGMIRSHGYLMAQLEALNDSLGFASYSGPDLCIFANFALANLANGRTSLVMPSQWHARHLAMMAGLPPRLAPQTITAGPAFMQRLLANGGPSSLKAIHVGGAPTDNAFFERIFARWPQAQTIHVYGSTEAEPVAHVDARLAVTKSRELGYFQTLCLGKPWHGLTASIEADQLWINGPHVSPEYVDHPEANAAYKRRDAYGALWHRMGDRIAVREDLWYFAGREGQKYADFMAEQRLYAALGHSHAFIVRDSQGEMRVYVEPREENPRPLVLAVLPEVRDVYATRLIRDRRHRARIDRQRSIRRARKL